MEFHCSVVPKGTKSQVLKNTMLCRLMVGQSALNRLIVVRIHAEQQKSNGPTSLKLCRVNRTLRSERNNCGSNPYGATDYAHKDAKQ